MNVKKMFASLTGVLMLATTVSPLVTGAASYSEELQGAYDYAYKTGITTMSSIDNANMYGELTRGQLSKMISNWAEAELGTKIDETAACSFSDADQAEGDLATYVKKACQMGLMGQGIEKFRPNDKVTRGEFGTTLSRALWGDKYDGANPYYANHLEALKEAGIMTKIDNPNQMEVRGWVMLMLERSVEAATPSECKDPAVILACALDAEGSACPEACRNVKADEEEDKTPVVVKSGDLQVSAERNEGASVISDGATSELDTLTFKASEDITLNSITLERYGYSTASSVASIWLEDLDGNKVTAEKSLSASKDTVTLSLKKDYKTIKDGDQLIVVITTPNKSKADLGTSIGFKVVEADASAKNLDLSNYSANLYDIIDYKGTDAKVEFKGSDKTYNYEEDKFYEVAKLKVTASNTAVLVNGFTLTQATAGTLDLDKYVDKVEVLVDGNAIDSKFSTKRDELKVSFDDQEIAINKNSTFTVNVALKDFEDFGDTVKLGLEDSSDVNVLEAKNKVRVTVWNELGGTSGTDHVFNANGVYGHTYTFMWGKINLTNVKLSSTIDAAEGADDIVIAEGKIALGGQAIRMRQLKLKPTDTAKVESVKFVVNDEEYEATSSNSWIVKDVVIEDDADIKVTVDIKDNLNLGTTAPTFKVEVNGTSTSAFNKTTLNQTDYKVEYDDIKVSTAGALATDNIIGSISISTVKIQPAKGSLTIDSTNKVEFKVKETNEKTVFKGTYTAKNTGNVNLDNVKIWRIANTAGHETQLSGALAASDVTFTVKIDGKDVATIDNPAVAADAAHSNDDQDFSAIAIESGKSVSVEVVANIYADTETDANVEYKMQLSGKDDNGNDAGNAERGLAPIAFVGNSSVSVSTNASMKQQDVVLANKNQNLATFIVKPGNKATTANLDQLDFTVDLAFSNPYSSASADDLFEVLIAGVEADNVEFGTDKTKLVVRDINTDITGETEVQVNFKEKLRTGAAPTISNRQWNATCTLTQDTALVTWKTYYSANTCASADVVASPDVADIATYYELGWSCNDSTIASAGDCTGTYVSANGGTANYTITLNKVNSGEDLGNSYVYKRTAVNSLVRVRSMSGNKDSDTKYIFDVEYSDDSNSETIKNVTFTYDNNGSTSKAAETWTNVQDGKSYSTPNKKDLVFYVGNITYVDGDNYEVSLDYDDYKDFFKTNGDSEDRLRAYADD